MAPTQAEMILVKHLEVKYGPISAEYWQEMRTDAQISPAIEAVLLAMEEFRSNND